MMEILTVIAAAAGAYAFGAAWYMLLAKSWVAASGIDIGRDGRPVNASNPVPYVVAFAAAMLVAGMMRHVFALSGIGGFGEGLVAGLGIGLFLAVPWLMTCHGFAGRPFRLLLIDACYIVSGSTIIGAVPALF